MTLLQSAAARDTAPPICSVPEGFTISQFAGDDLAHDIWCLTLDQKDQIWIGGPGYIKSLHDTDGDGRADRATLFTDQVRPGPMGLLVDGHHIISVESDAVVQYSDKNGDGLADGPPEILIKFTGKGGEHGPHGIRKGPDGYYYVVCGNQTGLDDSHANMLDSPVKKPDQGAIIRIAPFRMGSEIVAHGFRNPHDIAFSDDGRLFTCDSTHEPDLHLPWYTPPRLFDVAFGSHHGWLDSRGPGAGEFQPSYNKPEYYTVDRLAETDPGVPTGVEYYWHDAFPEKYRKGLFFACWSTGRLYFSPLEWESEDGLLQERRLKRQTPEIFARATAGADGTGGFKPVDLAQDSTGLLWVACGGRGTRGGIHRISPPGGPGVSKPRQLTIPQMMIGRTRLQPQLQHPHTVRTFLNDPTDLHLVYQAFQDANGGINHRPEPRLIDAGYHFSFLPTAESRALRDLIVAESGSTLLLDMDLKAEDALTRDAADFAEYWKQPNRPAMIEPWRDRNYRELARTLGCVKTQFPPILEHLTTALRAETPPTADLHYLYCLAQIPASRTALSNWRIASAFLGIDTKLITKIGAQPNPYWSKALQELFRAHCELSPGLATDVMWSHSLFGTSIHHARYVETISDPDLKTSVIQKMYQRIQDSRDNWTKNWARLVKDHLPCPEIVELRQIWDNQIETHEVFAAWLIEKADPKEDAHRLFGALKIGDSAISMAAAEKLARRDTPLNQLETEQAFSALLRQAENQPARATILHLLKAQNEHEALDAARDKFPQSKAIMRQHESLKNKK